MRNDRPGANNPDYFDRTFVGKPGCMITIALIIIIANLLYQYFN
ncbi:hypothetical protein [Pelagirhabdus alkalitolerans]|nr:hypothetical protein [Pelagirhabdus alkalitolerans]